MSSQRSKGAEELLLRLAELGSLVSKQLLDIAGDESLVSNVSVALLCRLDLEGPLRPTEIAKMEGLTTGGVSRLLDRLESARLIERKRGVLATDQRAVLVVITPEGRSMAQRMGDALAARLVEIESLVEEMNRVLDLAKGGPVG